MLFYIPIWLDLLFKEEIKNGEVRDILHSNMVRFIMIDKAKYITKDYLFYIPIWLDLLFRAMKPYNIRYRFLHSNMVRFIICE